MISIVAALLLMAASALAGVVAIRLAGRRGPGADADAGAAQGGALALLDIDDLAGVNTAQDFDTGDRLLNAVGDALRRALPDGATLERLQSGRFLLWMPDATMEAARDEVEHLRALASRNVVEGSAGSVSRPVSAGLVVADPSESRARAILRADAALAQAKRMGGDRLAAIRSLPIPALAPPREAIEEAIATRALEYHVQPILALEARRPVGVEALLRWNRPDGAVMGPAGFMDTLDRIPEAGSDLFPDMAVEAATPFVTGPAPIYATFNITGAALDGLHRPEGRWLAEMLERLPPERLVLEIVETAVVVCPETTVTLIESLRARGVRIALDDFGTGLSTLDRLRCFPVDILKIDRTFIDGLGGTGREEAILASLVALAHGLDIDIVAEGIETEEQATQLIGLGIRYGQGYHLGRPAPASDWAERMATEASGPSFT